ncbi:hypothetical protein L2207_20165, partial [Xanthomonas perforans]|nr:hypothetical protein [Xanthomonas perforans]MCF5982226.1 hypothetical protein [Xanthomonas perforans]MCF6022815.1 hypothetical protein [Xanthomonas perforans]MCF6031416.1 hypothetical protein [Xanthomonas perforans]MCF6035159.1 hypothetical protein [Xanthomonas perforans]
AWNLLTWERCQKDLLMRCLRIGGAYVGISAGNGINASTLTTVDTSDVLETRKRFKQTTSTSDETVHSTEFSAGGNLAMQAGNDLAVFNKAQSMGQDAWARCRLIVAFVLQGGKEIPLPWQC